MYLLGITDDPKSNAWGLDYRVRMEAEIFARENLFINEWKRRKYVKMEIGNP